MRKWGIFSFFAFLMSLCIMRAVDDDGAGGDDDSLLDKDLDDDSTGEKKVEEKTKVEDKTPPLDEKYIKLLDEVHQERALNTITKDMRAQYGDGFDMDAIRNKLLEMEKESPGSGEALFDRKGIELVYLKHFHNSNGEGEFDGNGGRGAKPLSADELILKINKGEASEEERKAFFSRYA